MNAIEVRDVGKSFGATRVLEHVTLAVPEGSTTAVLGASGSGKTTLLRLIAGFERVDAGAIEIAGRVVDDGRQSIKPQHRGVGFVPQEGALFPHMTVAGNVGFGLARKDRSRVGDLLEMVGMTALAKRYPHELSGGQQQRVALARALAIRPRVVLLDEPFSSLDATLRAGIRRDVARVLSEAEATAVLVTHDQDEALELADRIVVLRDGAVVASGAPRTLYADPADLIAAVSVGEANIIPAVVAGRDARCALGPIGLHPGDPVAPDGPARLLIRPEQLVLHRESPEGVIRATVTAVRFHGHDTLVDLVVDEPGVQVLLARVAGPPWFAPGQSVGVEVLGPVRAWPVGDLGDDAPIEESSRIE